MSEQQQIPPSSQDQARLDEQRAEIQRLREIFADLEKSSQIFSMIQPEA
ncbi:MAG TPA: hypothetical protein VGF67_10395 [Ktedonobacteraceae bacterium]|jgi:hypothetical protein